MKSVVITGSSGFVGKNLSSYIDDKYNIVYLSIRYGEKIILPISSDHIIHLSGKAHDLKNVSNPSDYYEANFKLTKQLYDAFLKSDAKKFIFISSVKAAADSVEDILTEDHHPNPHTHYGKSKLLAEEYILSQPLPDGKTYYILRPCMVHGPGNKGNLNLLYKFVSLGIPYPLAAYDNKRSFLSIDNLCFVIKEILERNDIQPGIYNVADDQSLSTNHLIKLLSLSLNRNPILWRVPKFLLESFSVLGDKLHLPLNSDRLRKLTDNFVVSNSKIKMALGKKFPVSTIDGILKTAHSFKKTS